jgi:DNA-directed RNA polymerase subunit RPC12/RpoP
MKNINGVDYGIPAVEYRCTYCGSADLYTSKSISHFGQLRCTNCGRMGRSTKASALKREIENLISGKEGAK